MVMLTTNLRASQPGDIAFGLVRAGAIFAVGFPMIDPLHFQRSHEDRPKLSPRRHADEMLHSGDADDE